MAVPGDLERDPEGLPAQQRQDALTDVGVGMGEMLPKTGQGVGIVVHGKWDQGEGDGRTGAVDT